MGTPVSASRQSSPDIYPQITNKKIDVPGQFNPVEQLLTHVDPNSSLPRTIYTRRHYLELHEMTDEYVFPCLLLLLLLLLSLLLLLVHAKAYLNSSLTSCHLLSYRSCLTISDHDDR